MSDLRISNIVAIKGVPTIITREILIDIILEKATYIPIPITNDFLRKLHFVHSKNPINKDEYYDLPGTLLKITKSPKSEYYSLNLSYKISKPGLTTSGNLVAYNIHTMQNLLDQFYELVFEPEALLSALI